jgi:hypothetical protein
LERGSNRKDALPSCDWGGNIEAIRGQRLLFRYVANGIPPANTHHGVAIVWIPPARFCPQILSCIVLGSLRYALVLNEPVFV